MFGAYGFLNFALNFFSNKHETKKYFGIHNSIYELGKVVFNCLINSCSFKECVVQISKKYQRCQKSCFLPFYRFETNEFFLDVHKGPKTSRIIHNKK